MMEDEPSAGEQRDAVSPAVLDERRGGDAVPG